MKRIQRWMIALLLLPVCYGVLRALWQLLPAFRGVPEGSFYFFMGFLGYFVLEWAFFRPIRTYVFGHELTHALAALMSGGEVKKFHVSKEGGSVHVTKSNMFVALAPYMVPLYALILLGAFFTGHYFYDWHRYWNLFLTALGVSIGFHIGLTVYALKQSQPDLKVAGWFLSAVVIFLGNSLSLVLLLGILFPHTVSWRTLLRSSAQETWQAYRDVGERGQQVWRLSQENFHEYKNRN